MGESAPASTKPDNIEALADVVRENGLSEDSAWREVAAGSREAIRQLGELSAGMFNLLKGKSSHEDDEDDDEDDDDYEDDDYEDDDYEDDDGDDDDGPGYVQARKGGSMNPSPFDDDPDPHEDADATAFLIEMQKSQRVILDELRSLRAENEALREDSDILRQSQVHLASMVEHLGGVWSESTSDLKKAVMASRRENDATRDALSRVPAPTKSPTFTPKLAPTVEPTRPPESSRYLGGVASERQERQLLMKATRLGVLTAFQENMYRIQGAFSANPAEHTAIAAKVAELASDAKVSA